MGEKLWTIKEVLKANYFQVSESTLRRMVAEGKLKAKRIGSGRGSIRIFDSSLKELAKHERNG